MTQLGRRASDHLRLSRALWMAGLLVPTMYFGAQLLAAPFYPGFDVLRTTMSDLGSERSTLPEIANTAALLGGLATFGTSAMFAARLRGRVPVGPLVLITVALALTGLMKGWAWLHPLPDPLHGSNPFAAASITLPLVLPLATWRILGRGGRVYLLLNLAVYALLFAMFSGLFPGPVQNYPGLMQRLLAATAFVPIGVLGAALARLPPPAKRSSDARRHVHVVTVSDPLNFHFEAEGTRRTTSPQFLSCHLERGSRHGSARAAR